MLYKKVFIQLFFLLMGVITYAQDKNIVQLQSFKNFSRLSIWFPAEPYFQWNYSSKEFTLFLPHTFLSSPNKSFTFKNNHLKSLTYEKNTQGSFLKGRWNYPIGKNALSKNEMKTYVYFDKTQSSLIIDFWHASSLLMQEYKNLKRDHYIAAQNNRDNFNASRSIASSGEEQNEYSSYLKKSASFCENPFDNESFIFLNIAPLHQLSNFNKVISLRRADEKFEYYASLKKNNESKLMSNAIKLYKKDEVALSILAIKEFQRRYKLSEFLSQMKFLEANALYRMNMNQLAEKIFNDILQDYPRTKEAYYSSFFLGLQKIQEKNFYSAKKYFLWLLNHYPEDHSLWFFYLVLAECCFYLGEFDDSYVNYFKTLSLQETPVEYKAEAMYKIGDIFMHRQQYEQAIISYQNAIQKYPQYKKNNYAAFLNIAEAKYKLGFFDQSLKDFYVYLETFSYYPESWQAHFRIAQIKGLQEKKPLIAPDVQEHLLSSINFYPFSEGASLARMLLISCTDHLKMKANQIKSLFSVDFLGFYDEQRVSKSELEEFKKLQEVRAWLSFESYEKAFYLILKMIPDIKNLFVKQQFDGLKIITFEKSLEEFLEKDRYKALNFFDQHYEFIKKFNFPIKLELLKKIDALAQEYNLQKIKDKCSYILYAQNNIDEIKIIEEAKSTWNQIKKNEKIESDIVEKIEKKLSIITFQSRNFFPKLILLSLFYEKCENLEKTLDQLSIIQILYSFSALEHWQADLFRRNNKLDIAYELYHKIRLNVEQKIQKDFLKEEKEVIRKLLGELSYEIIVKIKSAEDIYLLEADMLRKMNRPKEALAVYLSGISNQIASERFFYEYAQSIIESGQSKQLALQLLEDVAKKSQKKEVGFWVQLASEKLLNQKLENTLRSYRGG